MTKFREIVGRLIGKKPEPKKVEPKTVEQPQVNTPTQEKIPVVETKREVLIDGVKSSFHIMPNGINVQVYGLNSEMVREKLRNSAIFKNEDMNSSLVKVFNYEGTRNFDEFQEILKQKGFEIK